MNNTDKRLLRLVSVKHKLLLIADKLSDALVKVHNSIDKIEELIKIERAGLN